MDLLCHCQNMKTGRSYLNFDPQSLWYEDHKHEILFFLLTKKNFMTKNGKSECLLRNIDNFINFLFF